MAKLWDVCQIPDYRNISAAEHAALVGRIFRFLQTGRGHIEEDWFARMLAHCDRVEGDLDTLSNRISHIRTWTFITHRANWLEAPLYWQARAREIEDRLSDVLHQRLTQRFVDRRAALLVRRLRDEGEMTSSVAAAGEVTVEGEHLGRIEGFRFVPDATEGHADQKAVLSAALLDDVGRAAIEAIARALLPFGDER